MNSPQTPKIPKIRVTAIDYLCAMTRLSDDRTRAVKPNFIAIGIAVAVALGLAGYAIFGR
jgi:hypothetical protein